MVTNNTKAIWKHSNFVKKVCSMSAQSPSRRDNFSHMFEWRLV